MIICDCCGLVIEKKTFCSDTCRKKQSRVSAETIVIKPGMSATTDKRVLRNTSMSAKEDKIENIPEFKGDYIKKLKSLCKRHSRPFNAGAGKYECGCK